MGLGIRREFQEAHTQIQAYVLQETLDNSGPTHVQRTSIGCRSLQMGYEKGKNFAEKPMIGADEIQVLLFLTEAAEDPVKFGVHPKHQKNLKNMIRLLLEHLK